MRNRGYRFELLRMRPHDHIGWVYSGIDEFAALSTPFLAEGASLGERLLFVAEDPQLEPLTDLSEVLEPGILQAASTAEVYGDGVVDSHRQRATFAGLLIEALAEGYTGIRVAADNTPLVLDQERLDAWIRWEIVADRFMSENGVTGLCAFDRRRVDVDRLRHLATLHPLSSAGAPVPQFRLFADDGSLCVEGEVDSFAVEHLWLALENLPAKTNVVADLTKTSIVTKSVLSGLRELCDAGITVIVRNSSEHVRRLGDLVGIPAEAFLWDPV